MWFVERQVVNFVMRSVEYVNGHKKGNRCYRRGRSRSRMAEITPTKEVSTHLTVNYKTQMETIVNVSRQN